MRNLLGRLNARPAGDLERIADAWQIPLTGRDRLVQIGQLYRSMTRLTVVRASWDALEPRLRTALGPLLDAGDDGLSLTQLATALGQPESSTRKAVVDLFAQGYLALEGTEATLPIGELPRFFVPRELAHALRRIAVEQTRGDFSGKPFSDLLATLDDHDIEEAASRWGIIVNPGYTRRSELEAELTRSASSGRTPASLSDTLEPQARSLLDRFLGAPLGTPIPVDQLVGVGTEVAIFSRRAALSDLEDLLLIWPTALEDGVRALFMPADVIGLVTPTRPDVQPPRPVALVGPGPAYRHAYPLAWDMMVVLQRLFGPLAPPNLDPLDIPRPVAISINRMLWNRGSETPPVGYLELLIDLAAEVGLLREPEEGGRFERSDTVRSWRLKSWDEQAAALRNAWMHATTWIEGQARQDAEPWDVDWQGFRVKLLHHLNSLGAGDAWYRVDEVAAWLVEHDPNILGKDASVALRAVGGTGDRPNHEAGALHLVRATLTTILHWGGLVELYSPSRSEHLIRIDERLRRAIDARARAGDAEPRSILTLGQDLSVMLSDPQPIHVWSVLAFADPVTLGEVSTFAITPDSVRNARGAGFRPEQIVQFLERQASTPIDPEFGDRIGGLAERAERLELTAAVVIETNSPEELVTAKGLLEADGYRVTVAGNTQIVTIGSQRAVAVDIERIHARLDAAGLGPIVRRIRT